MTVALKVCLSQNLQNCRRFRLKSRQSIQRSPQRQWKHRFPSLFCTHSNQNKVTEHTGHEEHTAGGTVSHQVGPSHCRETGLGFPLVLHYCWVAFLRTLGLLLFSLYNFLLFLHSPPIPSLWNVSHEISRLETDKATLYILHDVRINCCLLL